MQFKSYPKAILRLEAADERMYELDSGAYQALLDKIIKYQPDLYQILYFVKDGLGGTAADAILLDFFLIWYYFEEFAVKNPNTFTEYLHEKEIKLTFEAIKYHGKAPNSKEAKQAIDAQLEALFVPDLWKKIIETFPKEAAFRSMDKESTMYCLVILLSIVEVFGKLEAESAV